MISSASSSDRAGRPELGSTTSESPTRATAPQRDRISTGQAAFLRAELIRQPEVRADVVARAQKLAADPNYPGPDVLRDIAGQILASRDASEQDT
jgi:hypothetical protein